MIRPGGLWDRSGDAVFVTQRPGQIVDNFLHDRFAADRIVAVDHVVTELVRRLPPDRRLYKGEPEMRHPLLGSILVYQLLEWFCDDGNRGLLESGFKRDAVANDRWRAVASMPHAHDDRVGLFFDFCEKTRILVLEWTRLCTENDIHARHVLVEPGGHFL